MDDLSIAREEAFTFEGLDPPPGAELIGTEQRNGDTYFYYRSEDNEYFFETESGYAFKAEMERAKKRKKKIEP